MDGHDVRVQDGSDHDEYDYDHRDEHGRDGHELPLPVQVRWTVDM